MHFSSKPLQRYEEASKMQNKKRIFLHLEPKNGLAVSLFLPSGDAFNAKLQQAGRDAYFYDVSYLLV